MRLSQKLFQVSMVLALVSGQVALGAPPRLEFREPMRVLGDMSRPKIEIPGVDLEASKAKRLEALNSLITKYSLRDKDMVGDLAAHGADFKIDTKKIADFAKSFQELSGEIETIRANAKLSPEEQLAQLEAKVAQRETLYKDFLDGTSVFKNSKRPGEGSVGKLGTRSTDAPVAGVGRGEETAAAGNKSHDDKNTPANARTGGAGGANWENTSATWKTFAPTLKKALGNGDLGAAVVKKVDAAIQDWMNEGAVDAASNFLSKLRDVVSTIAKLPAVGKNGEEGPQKQLTDILGQILATRGVTAASFEELGGFAKGNDVDALQGLHRMSMILKKLRASYAKTTKDVEPAEGTPEHDRWLDKRDAWVGAKLNDWVEYGENFRSSVTGESKAGKEGFEKWMAGTHEHEKLDEAAKRPEKELSSAFCSNCGSWMRKQCTTAGKS